MTNRKRVCTIPLLGLVLTGMVPGQDTQKASRTKPVPVRIILVTPYGFQPDKVSVPDNEFYLAFRNQTGVEVMVVPEDGSDDFLRSAMPGKHLDRTTWRGVQHFQKFPAPGIYHLKEIHHPD